MGDSADSPEAPESPRSPDSSSSIESALRWFRERFRADLSDGVEIVYRIELSDSPAESLSLQVADGRLVAERAPASPGADRPADVVYRLSADDLFGILAGRRNPDLLFMEKRIAIEGDLSLALKLRSLFRAGD